MSGRSSIPIKHISSPSKERTKNKQTNKQTKKKKRHAHGGSRGGWKGRREEVSLPLSHHTLPYPTTRDWGRVSHSIALIEGIEKNKRMFDDYCLTDR